jgi:O-antigen ligase
MTPEKSTDQEATQPLIFWLIIFYLFLETTHATDIYSFLGDINFQRIVMLFILGTLLITKDKIYKPSNINTIIILYLCILYTASIFSLNSDVAFAVSYNYLKLVLFYFVIILCINNEKQLSLFIFFYFIICFFYILMSLREFYFYGQNIYDMGVLRLTAWDPGTGPNAFALQVAYSLPFGALLLKKESIGEIKIFKHDVLSGKYFRYILIFAYFPSAIWSIILTNSRSGLVALFLFLIMLVLRTKYRIRILLLSFVAIALIFNMLPEETKERYNVLLTITGIEHESSQQQTQVERWSTHSAKGREIGFKRGMEIFSEHPILGVGPGVYQLVSGTGEQTHNLLAQLASEAGIFAIILFAALIIAMFRRFNIMKNSGSYALKGIAIASSDTLILMLFAGVVAHTMLEFIWLQMAAIGVLGSYFIQLEK